jgi:hypothetical protein
MENKNSFFLLILNLEQLPGININNIKDNLNDQVDLILSSMGASNKCYKFQHKSGDSVIYYFQTDNRKRRGQLVKYCEKFLGDNIYYQAEGLTRFAFESEIERSKTNKNLELLNQPVQFEEYSGNDISIFNNPNNWHPWQKEIYYKIFDQQTDSFQKPHPRQIISLVDKTGNSGKSSFFKWLFFNHPDSIGRIGYGSASQLRSSAVNLGKKQLYIVDLARSKSKDDRQEDLLSVLEDLKSGLVTNAMYGSGRTLLMEPPHIIVSSNYVLKYELLSADRWDVYEISNSNKLKKLLLKSENKIAKK